MNYGPFSKSFEYTYYGNGLKHTFTAPDGTVYTYNYDTNNELRSIQIPGVGNIEIPAYTWNRPATINYPGGTQRVYGYDALMWLESLIATDPGGNPILDYSHIYDNLGNIDTKQTEHVTLPTVMIYNPPWSKRISLSWISTWIVLEITYNKVSLRAKRSNPVEIASSQAPRNDMLR